jgi:hypothetical protein
VGWNHLSAEERSHLGMTGRSAADNRLLRLCGTVSRISWRTCVAHLSDHTRGRVGVEEEVAPAVLTAGYCGQRAARRPPESRVARLTAEDDLNETRSVAGSGYRVRGDDLAVHLHGEDPTLNRRSIGWQ